MERRFFFDVETALGFEALLAKFEAGAFASPFRSTVPLFAIIKDSWSEFRRILSVCRLPYEVDVHFEYRVKSPRGDGNPSQTDAMILSGSTALAVEAKWTEPRYPTVGSRLKRKGDGKSTEENETLAKEFVNGWLELLQPNATKPLRVESFSDAVYQVVHRAASACAVSRTPSLAYLHFEPAPRSGAATADQYRADLAQVHYLLGNPPGFPFYFVAMPISATSAFQRIEHLRKGAPETDRAVRSALLADRLFNFGSPRIETISNGSWRVLESAK